VTATFNASALSERSVLVTGASSGIGSEVCRRIAALGAQVIAVGRHSRRLQETADSLPGSGHTFVNIDLRDPGMLQSLDAALAEAHHPFGLVHCAGTQVVTPLKASTAEDFRQLYEIHVVVAAELIRLVSKRIGSRGDGSFVLLGSVSGLRGGAGVAPYAVAKAAVVALARSSALELVRQRIRVNCLVPGMVPTPMSDSLMSRLPEARRSETMTEHPLGLGTVDNVADAAAFLMADAASWITGAAIPVDGGFLAR